MAGEFRVDAEEQRELNSQRRLKIIREAADRRSDRQRPIGSEAVLNGKPVLWAGPDLEWQSPETFKKLKEEGYKGNQDYMLLGGWQGHRARLGRDKVLEAASPHLQNIQEKIAPTLPYLQKAYETAVPWHTRKSLEIGGSALLQGLDLVEQGTTAASRALGVDPFWGNAAIETAVELATPYVSTTALKYGSKALKIADKLPGYPISRVQETVRGLTGPRSQPLNIPGSVGAAGNPNMINKAELGKLIETGKLKHATSLSSKYTKKQWLAEARRLHVEDGLSMAEVRKQIGQFWVDPVSGNQFAIHTHRGKDVDLISGDVRKTRGAKRTKTTKIDKEVLVSLAEKYNQPTEIVDEFLKLQRIRKKELDDLIKRINTRIKNNPNVYSEDAIASLGHGKGAFRFPHSADVASNLDIEPHRLNVTRSNKDEISDAFNRALGRSTDLEEEFLKFIDPDLGEFHSKAFELGRHQKDNIIEYVVKNIGKDVNWQQHVDDVTGQQLFKSKEEFLIHEALELFSKVRLEEDGLKRIGTQLSKDLPK